MKKGQSALEFVMLTAALFFFFVSFMGIIYVNIEKKNYEKKDIALMIEAEHVADEIALAHEAGAGYERTFKLPETVLGRNYKIEIIDGNSVYVYTTDGDGNPDNRHSLSINTLEVTYDPLGTEDRYEIHKSGINTVKNINGVVNISNYIN